MTTKIIRATNRGGGSAPQRINDSRAFTGAIPPPLPPPVTPQNPPDEGTPVPTFQFRMQDAVTDGSGQILSIPCVQPAGFVLAAVPGHPAYLRGTKSNGAYSGLFPTVGARLKNDTELLPGTHSSFSLITSWRPDNFRGTNTREYWIYWWNLITGSNDHWCAAHIANVLPFNRLGHFTGGNFTWNSPVSPTPLNVHHTAGISYDGPSGTSKFYQNGVVVATIIDAPAVPMYVKGVSVGASYEESDGPIGQWYKGSVDEARQWFDYVLDDAEQMEQHEDLRDTYLIDENPWNPLLIAGLRQCLDTADKYGPGATNHVTTCADWRDRSGNNNNLANGTPGTEPVDGGIVGRPNGYSFIKFNGTNQFFGTSAISAFVAASGAAYDFWFAIRVDGTATTGGPAYNLDTFFADTSGYLWGGIDGSGVLKLGHWDGGERNISVPFTVGQWMIVHWWFDGSFIRAQVNNLTPITPVAATNIVNTAISMRVGRSVNNNYAEISMVGTHLWNNVISAPNATSHRNYLLNRYEL